MANKNTHRRRRLNPAQTGANPVISQNLRRNVELAIVGGRTVYRPIDPSMPSFPMRTPALNLLRRHRGRADRTSKKNIELPTIILLPKPANLDTPAETQQAA